MATRPALNIPGLRKPTRLALILGALAIATIAGGVISVALFTSTATVPANTFSTGSVVISTSPTSALVTFSAMAPGDQVTAPITVSNDGTLDLRYAITSAATNSDTKGLKDQLVLTVKSGVTSCTTANYAADGTQLYSGDLDSTAGKIVGDVAVGQDTGDRVLAASANEVLCFHVGLPT
ncbi:MAG TPA: TasA family protein, partial [Candidatus Limnocylindrales bacterium]